MIGIYCRVSTDEQGENGYSLTVQKQRGKVFAESLNESYELYSEIASAKGMQNRTRLKALLQDIETGKVHKVWCIESSRLSRDLQDSINIMNIFYKHNIELYINGSRTDLKLIDQRFLYNINACVSQYERERLIERISRGIDERKNLGLQVSPHLLGYKRKYDSSGNAVYVVDEKEAEIVKLIFKLKNEGKSLRKIAKHLNDNGIKTKKGCIWRRKTVANVLKRKAYYGKTITSNGEMIESKIYKKIL